MSITPASAQPASTPMSLSPATRDNTIIFIGPEGSGKSTIGRLISPLLNTTLYSLDRHRDELYAPYNYSKQKADEIYDKEGLWAFYAHWNEFEYKTVCSLLKNEHPSGNLWGQILDFGAGHSVYTDETQLSTIQKLMAPFQNVFLFLPCEDIEEGIKITEERRGHKLELNRFFLSMGVIGFWRSMWCIRRTAHLKSARRRYWKL
jgi:shikimate kinase